MSFNVAVYGGNGALGRCLVNYFKSKNCVSCMRNCLKIFRYALGGLVC